MRSSVHFLEGPLVLTSVDGTQARGRFAIAVSDMNATYCDRGTQEVAVATFIVSNGVARPSNSVRFVGDPIG
jgi:hypothetical protein